MKLLCKVQHKCYPRIVTYSVIVVVFLLDYVFPDFKYLERPYKTKLKKSIGQNIIKCGAGIWGAKKI